MAFGSGPIEDSSEPDGERKEMMEATDGESLVAVKEKKEREEHGLDSILPETNFPWAKAVQRLPRFPSAPREDGWLRFSEVHHYMPLSLWLIIMKMYSGQAVGSLYRKYSM